MASPYVVCPTGFLSNMKNCLALSDCSELRSCTNYYWSIYPTSCSEYNVPAPCPDCPACPPPITCPTCPPADTVVIIDTVHTCNAESFYEDFNHGITDTAMWFFLMKVFVGILAVKAVIKTIKSAIR